LTSFSLDSYWWTRIMEERHNFFFFLWLY
jgi:hypothetical protein